MEDHLVIWGTRLGGSGVAGIPTRACSGCGFGLRAAGLPEKGAESLPESGLIGRDQSPQLLEHEGGVDGGEHRFEDGRLEQARIPPVLDRDLTHRIRREGLTRDGHDD